MIASDASGYDDMANKSRAQDSKTAAAHRVSRRLWLQHAGAAAAALHLPSIAVARKRSKPWDLIVVGGGNAGLPAAIFAAARGARVLVVEAAGRVGGTLFFSSGQMSAAGTKLQQSRGITDSAQLHYDDIMRISRGTADPSLVRLAVFNAAAAFDWLTDHGFQVRPEHPVTGTTHEPYSQARYAWGFEGGGSILKVLEAELKPLTESGGITVLTGTSVTELIQRRDGAVLGVTATDGEGRHTQHLASHVALTCGGYTANPQMYQALEGATDYTAMTYPFSLGAGITLGLSVGGYVRGGQYHTPLFGAVLAGADLPSPIRALARHFPGDRPPWEIFVNSAGRRFLCEDVLSHNEYEQRLREQPEERCWAVFDDKIFRAASPLVTAGFGGPWSPQDTIDAFAASEPMFSRADSIAGLASAAGVSSPGLVETVAAYNLAQSSGNDRFGRKYMPLPIAKPPFYAIQLQSWNLTSYAGLAVDGQLRVIRHDGRPIRNLYAAGELLGMGQLMGQAVCGGMSVTPALALGRLLGKEILKFT